MDTGIPCMVCVRKMVSTRSARPLVFIGAGTVQKGNSTDEDVAFFFDGWACEEH